MAEVEQAQPVVAGLTSEEALRRVLKAALYRDKLAKGLHEACKAIEARRAKLCVLAEDCSEAKYKDLVQALCKENDIPLMIVPRGTDIGEWLGFCKYDAQNNPRKVKRCSCAVLKDYAFEDEAAATLQRHISTL
eukprot:TRINITY_DN407_c0_g1_i2.p1 TRINITY_DN407_c0_g1~~TRINITY_DN407_c0_g1_i2.p1  ORF type:complete len:134 (+),score=51.32 TRINITY_DN407_c0_g1_i2:86-487(+)